MLLYKIGEDKTLNNFDISLYENLIKLVNYESDKEVNLEEKGDLLDKIEEINLNILAKLFIWKKPFY